MAAVNIQYDFPKCYLQALRHVCGRLGKQISVFTTSKNNLSEIHVSQGLYWGSPSLSSYFLLSEYKPPEGLYTGIVLKYKINQRFHTLDFYELWAIVWGTV